VRDSLTVIVLVGAMFWLDWLMAFVVLAVYPLGDATDYLYRQPPTQSIG